MIALKKEWRVKEKNKVPKLKTSDDDMDLLDEEESPLIKDRSLPLASMDINMVFTLPVKIKGMDEEIAQLCLGPKEVMFEKPKELS
jgi:hypothetical protein